ncbi:hypothetical protein GOODEAATRI_023131, partial [Goodea atripinnis]
GGSRTNHLPCLFKMGSRTNCLSFRSRRGSRMSRLHSWLLIRGSSEKSCLHFWFLSQRGSRTGRFHSLFLSVKAARTHFLNLLCLSGSTADVQGTARQGPSGFCTIRQGSTVVPGVTSSTAGFLVTDLLIGCSEGPLHTDVGLLSGMVRGASGLAVVLLGSVSAQDDHPAARLNSVSARDNLFDQGSHKKEAEELNASLEPRKLCTLSSKLFDGSG